MNKFQNGLRNLHNKNKANSSRVQCNLQEWIVPRRRCISKKCKGWQLIPMRPPSYKNWARCCSAIMVGQKNIDLSALTEELREIVEKALDR